MYEKMYEICYYNDFDGWFRIWDIIDQYVIYGIDIKELTNDLKIVADAYREALFGKGVE